MSSAVLADAAAGVSGLIAGPGREGVLLATLTEALIVGVATPDGVRVISLLSARGSGVPNGVRLASGSLRGHRVGEQACVGSGGIRTGSLDIRVVRTWSSAVYPIRTTPSGLVELEQAVDSALCGVPAPAVEALRAAWDDQKSGEQRCGSAIGGLIGLGQGLTPGGDDVVAGMLIGLHAVGHSDLARRMGTVDRLAERTTLLSADLIRLAAAGHACLEVLGVLTAMNAGALLDASIDRLLSVGHTSGADLVTGLAIGLRVGARRQEAR